MYYFAYGSNMLAKRLEGRVGRMKDLGIATLKEYNLKFNKQSTDGSGKTNIVPDEDSKVLGVVYELTEEQKLKLDESEIGYSRKSLEMNLGSSDVYMDVYIADQKNINNDLLPKHAYLDYLIQGAIEHQFPETYIESLKQVETLN